MTTTGAITKNDFGYGVKINGISLEYIKLDTIWWIVNFGKNTDGITKEILKCWLKINRYED